MRSITAALGRIATLTSLDFSYTDIGAEGARFSHFLWTRTASAAALSVPRHHQQGHGEPLGRPSPLLQARSQGRLVGRLRSTRRVELWGTTISSSRPLSPPAPPCWRSSTSLCTSGCLTNSNRSGSRRAVATWRLPTSCRAPRPRCARSCSRWPTPPRDRAKARAHPQAARHYDGPRVLLPTKSEDSVSVLVRLTILWGKRPHGGLKDELPPSTSGDVGRTAARACCCGPRSPGPSFLTLTPSECRAER